MAAHNKSLRDEFPLRLLINGEDVTFTVADGFSFSNTSPGGFEAASFPIPRDLPHVLRGDPVRLECGLRTAWEGRVKEVQRSLGNKTLVQCEGNRAKLKENTLAEIFVDRDMSHWAGDTLPEQIRLVGLGYTPSSVTIGPGAGGAPSLVEQFTGPWAAGGFPVVDAWYNAHGLPIAALCYAWERGLNVNAADANWLWSALLAADSAEGENNNSGNLRAVGPAAAVYLVAAKNNLTWALLRYLYNAAGGSANMSYALFWSSVAVYGKAFNEFALARNLNGVPGSTGHGADPVGYYTDEIARFIASVCPGIQEGLIEKASQFLMPHAVYFTPVPLEQILEDMAKFAGWTWGVWESLGYLLGNQEPRLDFVEPPKPGEPTAWCWRKECETLDIRENIENLYDSAKVTYSEPSGEERSVEVSVANPALQAVGLHRQIPLSLGIGTQAAAEAWGVIQLELLNDQARVTGTASINSPIHSISGANLPAWMLRAGVDRLRIPDLPCSDVWGEHNDLPISRVECSGSENGLTTSVEFGLGPNLIEVLAAQLAANLTASGV